MAPMSQVPGYRPSLSFAVHDKLYSYWRLPSSVRSSLQQTIPLFFSDVKGVVAVDWNSWLSFVDVNCQNFENSVNEIDKTWTLALYAEKFLALVSVQFDPDRHHSSWRRLCELTHFKALKSVAMMLTDDSGEFFMAFTIGVTILEKALYDLYDKKSNPVKSRKKNMILRDLLHSDTLADAVPEGLLHLLKVLFLPSGLNLRNLVWHGFMIPAEFPKCFGCLTLLLITVLFVFSDEVQARNTSETVRGKHAAELFRIGSFNGKFVTNTSKLSKEEDDRRQLYLAAVLRQEPPTVRDEIIRRWTSATFVPKGRSNLLRRAIDALVEQGDELWFLFAALPVLEHALRIQFLHVNQERAGLLDAYSLAQVDEYYSTLDGFGQRDKHQVLLHPGVLVQAENVANANGENSNDCYDSVANALYEQLPFASLSALLDLFMMSSGPNLRAKLCHGEANLTNLLRSSHVEALAPAKLSSATLLLFEAFVLLCESSIESSSVACAVMAIDVDKDSLPPAVRCQLQVFGETTTCSFHPFYQLYRALSAAHSVASAFAAFRAKWTDFDLYDVDGDETRQQSGLTQVQFAAIKTTDGLPFTLVEKSDRVTEFIAALCTKDKSTSELPAGKKKSFAHLIGQLNDELDTFSVQICHDFTRNDRPDLVKSCCSIFLTPAEIDSTALSLSGAVNLLEGSVKRNLLALSDQEGLGVAACMMEIIACCQRSLEMFRSRIEQFQQLVVTGKARTKHRRSLLTSIFFLPVFERMQMVSLSIVERHVLRLRDVAADMAACIHSQKKAIVTCPRVVQVEQVQCKLLQCITSFEGCTGSYEASQKSNEQAVHRALQFLNSKALKAAFPPLQ
uniref:DUF4209 domain-containing protein n=1 Tax=Peronospora matthiolae TaxID=2874970 RepID=A0AAV1URU3_9STRA